MLILLTQGIGVSAPHVCKRLTLRKSSCYICKVPRVILACL